MKRALGKGLADLLSASPAKAPAPTEKRPIQPKTPKATGEPKAEAAVFLPLDSIKPNKRQPRTVFDDGPLRELADSIKSVGVLQPLLVRPSSGGGYELIAGERRFRAAKIAGLKAVPVVIRSADAQESLELALIENVQREDISAAECARAYRKLIDEFNLTQEQVAQRVGKSRVAITNTLRLLKLPDPVLAALESGQLTEGHARALLSLESRERQESAMAKIVSEGLSVRAVEAMSGTPAPLQAKNGKKKVRQRQDPNQRALEEAISIAFGSPAHLEKTKSGGRLVVDFYSNDDLQRILDRIGIEL